MTSFLSWSRDDLAEDKKGTPVNIELQTHVHTKSEKSNKHANICNTLRVSWNQMIDYHKRYNTQTMETKIEPNLTKCIRVARYTSINSIIL